MRNQGKSTSSLSKVRDFLSQRLYAILSIVFLIGVLVGTICTKEFSNNQPNTSDSPIHSNGKVEFEGIIVAKNENNRLSCIRITIQETDESKVTDTNGEFSFTIDRNKHEIITYLIEDLNQKYKTIEERVELVNNDKPIPIRLDPVKEPLSRLTNHLNQHQ